MVLEVTARIESSKNLLYGVLKTDLLFRKKKIVNEKFDFSSCTGEQNGGQYHQMSNWV